MRGEGNVVDEVEGSGDRGSRVEISGGLVR